MGRDPNNAEEENTRVEWGTWEGGESGRTTVEWGGVSTKLKYIQNYHIETCSFTS